MPYEGAFCDLMWSDPDDSIQTWGVSPRGAGWHFGEKVTKEFIQINGIGLIARAHQLVMDGYRFWFTAENLVTIWSAPNYCYRCNNDAAFMHVTDNKCKNFIKFKKVHDKDRVVNYSTIVPYFL